VVAVLNIPYLYYFSETYHRHFGLVADGRNEQSYASGETTHKHRAEGCIVYLCYRGYCCTRKSYMFRQESVDEDPYYRLQRADNSFMEQVDELERGDKPKGDGDEFEDLRDGRGTPRPENTWRARRRSLAANFKRSPLRLPPFSSPAFAHKDDFGLPSGSPHQTREAGVDGSENRLHRFSQRFNFTRSSSQPSNLFAAGLVREFSPDLLSPGAFSAPSAHESDDPGEDDSNVFSDTDDKHSLHDHDGSTFTDHDGPKTAESEKQDSAHGSCLQDSLNQAHKKTHINITMESSDSPDLSHAIIQMPRSGSGLTTQSETDLKKFSRPQTLGLI